MNQNKTGSTTAVNAVCAIIFVLFTFHYLYSFQGDILGMIQYSWSRHETHYDRMTGGVILTFLACLISFFVATTLRLPRRTSSMAYFPAMALMGVLTAVDVDDAGMVKTSVGWGVISAVALVAYPFLMRALAGYSPFVEPLRSKGLLSQIWSTNIAVLLMMVLMVYGMGNTDRSLHTRLAVERLAKEGRCEEALEVGIPQHDHGEGLTMWRAFAMSRLTMEDNPQATLLGEKLFQYNIDLKSGLLPKTDGARRALLSGCYPIWQSIGFVPYDIDESPKVYLARQLRRKVARKAAKDYLLCTYLLDKDLKDFVSVLPRYYDMKKALPQHYAEAMAVYVNSHPVEMSADSILSGFRNAHATVMEDYSDFLDNMRARKEKQQKYMELRDNFGGTYWYYYHVRK